MAEYVEIDVPNCTIIPKQQHIHMHATPHGTVIFTAKAGCWITFTDVPGKNPVFGPPNTGPPTPNRRHLLPNTPHKEPVICANGQTVVTIDGCVYALTSDPTDIIVP